MEMNGSFQPRCILPVIGRSDYYSSRDGEFWHRMVFCVNPSSPTEVLLRPRQQVFLHATYRQLHRILWRSIQSDPCPHGGDLPLASARLDGGVVTVGGFGWYEDLSRPLQAYRICVVLVKGNRWARWLAMAGLFGNKESSQKRQVMLRHDECCEECAVDAAAALPGKWIVII